MVAASNGSPVSKESRDANCGSCRLPVDSTICECHPGNRLEVLKGKRAGQHSIRVNDQFRVCFRWTPAGPEAVEIVDYH